MSKTAKKTSNSSGVNSPSPGKSKNLPAQSSTDATELILRPSFAKPVNISKVYVSLETLRACQFEAGGFVRIGTSDILAILTPQAMDSDVCLLSRELQLLANVFPGERIRLQKALKKPRLASKITLSVLNDVDEQYVESIKSVFPFMGLVQNKQWIGEHTQVLSVLCDSEDSLSNVLSNLDIGSEMSSSKNQFEPFLVDMSSEVVIKQGGSSITSQFARIGGLQKELELLRTQTELPLKYPGHFARFNIEPERGVLLYGPPGTGKTMLLKAIARDSKDVHILRLNGPSLYSKYQGETEEKIRGYFEEAERFAPAIIFIDEIDALAPKRDSDYSGETESRVVSTLLTLMDGMRKGGRVVVIGATNRPNTIDPALRRPGRFGHEIEIGIPDSNGRFEILKLILKDMPHHLNPSDFREIAEKSHGYVGADLQALVREAVVHVIRAAIQVDRRHDEMYIERSDLDTALVSVRPSAMREITLELPQVRWSDIGGQDATIQRLRETVEWPIQRHDAFQRLGISPPRGILLYGPPGCSKTLLAKALANEAGLNFLAVKGPELFNKYVGESERALREMFRKARQAAPSIIFFDEIDALSVARGDGEAGGDRVLTSLLNEMDGIEALNGVVILAATNRPDVIDSALMRPGRLDRLIYVSPPDFKARKQILLIQFTRMAVDESVDLEQIAEATDGFSGAEIVNICQEAGLLALNDDPDVETISQNYFDSAIKGVRKTITPEMLKYFESFSGQL